MRFLFLLILLAVLCSPAQADDLTTGLVSYWKLDEASGNAEDAHSTNDLTNNGTTTFTTGKINNCGSFNGTDQYFSIADNAALSTGDIDFTAIAWVNPDTIAGNDGVVGKFLTTGNQREWQIRLQGGNPRFAVSSDGTAQTELASTGGNLSTGAWSLIIAWHDAANDTINIQVNNGTPDSASYASGASDKAGAFTIGAIDGPANFFDGLIDEVGFWDRVLTSDERTALYNSGNGKSYDTFSSGTPSIAVIRSLQLRRNR